MDAARIGWTKYSVLSTWYLAAIVLVFACSFASAADEAAYRADLVSLAAKCDELDLREQATITRHWPVERHPKRQYLFLPSTSDLTAPKSSTPEAARQWHQRFLELRRQ